MPRLLTSLLTLAFIPALAAAAEPAHDGIELSIWVKNLDSAKFYIRQRAVQAILQIGPAAKPALPRILQALRRDDDPDALQTVATVALVIDPDGAGPAVRDLMLECRTQRRSLPDELIKEHGAALLPHLVALFKDADQSLRCEAIRAVLSLESLALEALPDLIACLDAPPLTVRTEAFRAIERLAPDRLPDLLPQLVRLMTDRGISTGKFYNLVRERADRAVPYLAERLTAEDGRHPLDLAQALANFGSEGAPHLIRGLTHSRPTVRLACARALDDITEHGRPAIPLLLLGLDDADPRVRFQCAMTLIHIESAHEPTVIPTLIDLVNGNDPVVCQEAVEFLFRFGKSAAPAVPALLRRLEDNDRTLCLKCIETLLEIDPKLGPRTVPALVRILKDSDNLRRNSELRQAVRIASEIGPAALPVLPHLARNFEHTSRNIRLDSALAALRISSVIIEQAAPVLRETLQSRSSYSTHQSQILQEIMRVGPLAKCLLPELLALIEDGGNRERQIEAACAVLHVSPADAEPAIRFLRQSLHDADRRDDTLTALTNLGPLASFAVHDLTELLRDSPKEAKKIIDVLAAIGPPAQAAVPVLEEYARGDRFRDEHVAAALAKIDPPSR